MVFLTGFCHLSCRAADHIEDIIEDVSYIDNKLIEVVIRDWPIILLCCSAQILTNYAQYYAHVKNLCFKSDCSIRVYSLASLKYLIILVTVF